MTARYIARNRLLKTWSCAARAVIHVRSSASLSRAGRGRPPVVRLRAELKPVKHLWCRLVPSRCSSSPKPTPFAPLLDTESERSYRDVRPGDVVGNENHLEDASWKGSARCPPAGRRERRGRAAGPRIPTDRSAPRGARGGPRDQDAPHCRGSPPAGHSPSARGEPGHCLPEPPPARRRGASRRTARTTSPLRCQHPGPPSLHVSPLRAHRGRRGTGCRTAVAGTFQTRGGPHRSHDHASQDRLLRSLPEVPGEGARSAGQTSSGGGCQRSRRESFRAVSGRRHGGLATTSVSRFATNIANQPERKDRYV